MHPFLIFPIFPIIIDYTVNNKRGNKRDNKRVIGKFKDELNCELAFEFEGLK